MGVLTPTVSDVTEQAPTKKPAAFHIPSLDGVRALAFMIVFVSHAGLRDLVPGGFGVSIFFVLSGFLITTLLRMEVARFGTVDLPAFYMRRVFRILPLLYIMLAAALLLTLAGQLDGVVTRYAVISQVLQWSNYFLIVKGGDAVAGGTIVLWSLAVEEHFYLIFPVVYRSICRRFTPSTQGWILFSACVACLAWRLVIWFLLPHYPARTELGTDTRFDGLLVGCIMAIVANPALDNPAWLTAKRLRWLAIAGLGVLLFTFLYRNNDFRNTWRFSLQGFALLPLFTYVIRAKGSIAYRILNTPWIAQVGVLTYSLYLVHAIFLDWCTKHLHTSKTLIAIIALTLAIIAAKLLQVFVERPMLKFRKRYAHVRT